MKAVEELSFEEAINSSLAGLIFAFNNHYGTFQHSEVQKIYRSSQIIDTSISDSDSFEILSGNSLLHTLRSHAIILSDNLRLYSTQIERASERKDLLLPIVKFVKELRHAHAHIDNSSCILKWDVYNGAKRPFRAEIPVPVDAQYRFDPTSDNYHVLSFRVVPGKELNVNRKFVFEIVLLSYHIRHIVSLKTVDLCDEYLGKNPPKTDAMRFHH